MSPKVILVETQAPAPPWEALSQRPLTGTSSRMASLRKDLEIEHLVTKVVALTEKADVIEDMRKDVAANK